jgi:hypothetical protein
MSPGARLVLGPEPFLLEINYLTILKNSMDYPNHSVKSSNNSHKLLVKLLEAYDLPRKDVMTGSDPLVKLKVTGLHRSRKSTYKSVPLPGLLS